MQDIFYDIYKGGFSCWAVSFFLNLDLQEKNRELEEKLMI